MSSQTLSPEQMIAMEPQCATHVRKQQLKESKRTMSSTTENEVASELEHHDFPCLQAKEIKWGGLARSRMSTMATEADFELSHKSCKALNHEPEELAGGDDQSSTDEGSIMAQACGTEVSEAASDWKGSFEFGAARSATSYSRSFLMSVNVKLNKQTQQSASPLGNETLPKMLPVYVKRPTLSLAGSATNPRVTPQKSISSLAQAASRGIMRGVGGKQAESTMTVDSPKQSTIMLRNIPNRTTRAALTQQLKAHGFGGAYDLVYVPIDRSTGNLNLGYAFVNFRQEAACSSFRDEFHGKCAKVLFPKSSSDKVLIIDVASVQGRDPYLTRLSSLEWPVGSDAWQPLILDDNGRRIKLAVGQPSISKAAAAAACAASHNSAVLRAEAPEFVPIAGLPTTGENNYEMDNLDHLFTALTGENDYEVDSLDHLFTALCSAQFCGPPGLTSPVLECFSVQPECHMAALAKATRYAQSVQVGPSGSMGLTSDSETAEATVTSGVRAARCGQDLEETIPLYGEQPANMEDREKPCTADIIS